jgi:hypothetical protein
MVEVHQVEAVDEEQAVDAVVNGDEDTYVKSYDGEYDDSCTVEEGWDL